MKNKTAAALLALFLGGLGVHRFYLGQTGKGLLYLIFCWTFIPSVIALIDFVIFLTMDDQTFNQKYNSGVSTLNKETINVSDELEKLHSLKEKGIISEVEFEERKKKLL